MIRTLLLANAIVFVLGLLGVGSDMMFYLGALFPIGSEPFAIWQYFTYMFLHAGFGHFFFNMIALWMFGIELENVWGSKRFLVFYLVCGIGAGLIHSIVTALTDTAAPTVGASGAIMGVLVAFGMLFPDRIIYFQLFLPMKAKYFVMLLIAIDLFFGIGGGQNDNVARFAHLGGALIGFILVMTGGRMTLGGIFDRGAKSRRTDTPRVIDARFREADIAPAPSARHAPLTSIDFGSDQERIDALLDKISREGYQTLTDEEKAILADASRRMGR